MIGDPHDPELPVFKSDDLAQLGQLRPERRARNLDREIPGAGEPAKVKVFSNGRIGDERLKSAPVPGHRFPNFIQHPRQIGGFFVSEAHPGGMVSMRHGHIKVDAVSLPTTAHAPQSGDIFRSRISLISQEIDSFAYISFGSFIPRFFLFNNLLEEVV